MIFIIVVEPLIYTIQMPINSYSPQKKIDASLINHTLGDCLDNLQIFAEALEIDRITIILETVTPSVLTVTSINVKTQQKEFWSQAFNEESEGFQCILADQPIQYNSANYRNYFEKLIPNNFFQDAQSIYHIPLHWNLERHSAIQFIRVKEGCRFSSNETNTLKSLAHFVAKIIERSFSTELLSIENHTLKYELLKNQILVEVTDAAISIQEMEQMVKVISKDIIQFCNIEYIGLLLQSETPNSDLQLYNSFRTLNKELDQKHHVLKSKEPLAKEVLNQSSEEIFSIEALYERFPKNDRLGLMLDIGLQSLCTIPLRFGERTYGALLLAHSTPDIFNPNTIPLFKQIADRVVIAAKNIYSYQNVKNLNHSLTNENLYLSETIQQIDTFGEIVGTSNAIQTVLKQVEMVANSNSTVLLLGETGTGKELFAKAIHNRSNRHDKRMIKINCSAVPANLLESELFGHEKGAFTGANSRRIGRFELAQDSTLLLDEIGDIPLELQSKLLRVLQEREIERIGGNSVIPVNARIISATNCNLEKMIEKKLFRADLFYRLNVFPIIIPPLRDRKEDIPLLAQFFTQKFAKSMKKEIDSIAASTLDTLCAYDWPGNVRELANIIERAVILNQGKSLSIDGNLFPQVKENVPQPVSEPNSIPTTKATTHLDPEEDQREQILRVLKETNGIIAGPKGAAIKLGVKRTTLLSRMQRLGISPKDVIQED